jgi:RsiW-degrading membrane proteinase PrsW (M82 family)
VIIVFANKYDQYNKEPTKLLAKLFIFVFLSVIPALILENLLLADIQGPLVQCLLIAFIEESVKFFPTMRLAFNHEAFDEIYDGILYCILISLGFATIENIMYVATSGVATGLLRAVTAVPAHAMFAVSMGYNMSIYKAAGSKRRLARSLISPVLIHMVYDYILFTPFKWTVFIFIAYLIGLYAFALRRMRQTSSLHPFKSQKSEAEGEAE